MSGTNEGWVKFYRRLLGSAIWQNHNLMRFWTWCLLKATHETITIPVRHAKVTLEPGQFIFTRPMACTETGLSEKTVRLCLETLRAGESAEIGLTKGHNFSVVTIIKWEDYQNRDASRGRLKADKGPAKGRPINKEDKKKRNSIGVATASAPTDAPTWQQWVAACRTAGRKDPAPSPGALKAAEDLAAWVPDLNEQRRIMDAYLTIDNDYLRRQGYQLANLTKYKFEEARAIADGGAKSGLASPDDAYEASPEDIAIWEEFGRQNAAKEAVNA